MSDKIIQLNEDLIKHDLKDLASRVVLKDFKCSCLISGSRRIS